MNIKALISGAVTVQLIYDFIFAYTKAGYLMMRLNYHDGNDNMRRLGSQLYLFVMREVNICHECNGVHVLKQPWKAWSTNLMCIFFII